MFRLFFISLFLGIIVSCHKDEKEVEQTLDIVGCDLSQLPEIETYNVSYYDATGNTIEILDFLKKKGVNTVRLRLWHRPSSLHSGFEEVTTFAQRIKQKGLKVWLTVHYSDTWADPGHQMIPQAWQNADYNILKDSVYNYTKKIVTEIKPDYIQIGNEINPGFLLPIGDINQHEMQFKSLLGEGIEAVRTYSPQTKIIIHYAGHESAAWFYNKIANLDFDIMGLSHYPYWHGKDLTALQNNVEALINTFDKELVIAETAYPFTLEWNDWTHNLIGLENQMINEYPSTPQGQKAFLEAVKNICLSDKRNLGFAYWAPEWIAYKGAEAQDGSPWENQALFDFNNRALPALDILK